jgi:hypothetical protein
LLLTGETANECLRVHLGDGLFHAMPYSYVIAAGASVEQYRRALDPIVHWMRGGEPASYGRAYPRPALGPIVHMRALQAHDGVNAGASQREVAAILFGDDAVAERWTPDSELRAHVRYLIGRARSLVNLGYLSLFGGKRSREETTRSIEKTP